MATHFVEPHASRPPESTRFERIADIGLFVTVRTGTCTGHWEGRMRAAEQRALFGRFFGKGTLIIDGATERIQHCVTRCFGLDYEFTADLRWGDI